MGKESARERLAENLRVLRVMRDWTQEELAEAAGLHRTYVGAVERATRNVSLDNLEKLASAFGLTIPDLLAEPDPAALGQRLLQNIRKAIREE